MKEGRKLNGQGHGLPRYEMVEPPTKTKNKYRPQKKMPPL